MAGAQTYETVASKRHRSRSAARRMLLHRASRDEVDEPLKQASPVRHSWSSYPYSSHRAAAHDPALESSPSVYASAGARRHAHLLGTEALLQTISRLRCIGAGTLCQL